MLLKSSTRARSPSLPLMRPGWLFCLCHFLHCLRAGPGPPGASDVSSKRLSQSFTFLPWHKEKSPPSILHGREVELTHPEFGITVGTLTSEELLLWLGKVDALCLIAYIFLRMVRVAIPQPRIP